ncbi:hypothetical protein FIBSPDRAFT_827135 [Athelia psychrophila]|uniref:Uncharacterized protein n=1 Tax=Athelia psychrophila TaxID=1759441 RepID=A0A166IZS2_9AGAM|nr:hypothetical protein FIBSPDRAFT_827135 [Fibularhizoctonia sp. CBS 109695]
MVSTAQPAFYPCDPLTHTCLQGGGGRYPYPKNVWSPAGGWWVRPSNWKSNTAIVFGGILAIGYGVFTISAAKEWRYVQPDRHIPSMNWAKQYQVEEKKET